MTSSNFFELTHIRPERQYLKYFKVISLILIVCIINLGHQRKVNAQTVDIPDPGLRAALELALNKETGDDITQADMESLETLQVTSCDFLTLEKMGFWWRAKRWICQSTEDILDYRVQDLTGLEFATNLTHLSLDNNQISKITQLKELTNLTHLSLGQNQISDISSIKALTNLTLLSLIYNKISDLSPIIGLKRLKELDLEGNLLSDVSILKGLKNLRYLSLRKNNIYDISSLKDLTKLTYISLRENHISDVSSLKELRDLTYLHIGFNYRISDVTPLKNLTNLLHLQLDHNKISDVSPLKNLTNLKHLDASDNQISDLSSLKDLKKLTWIDLDTNKNLDISHLRFFPNLTFLDIHDNNISNLSHLKDLKKLERLDLDDNAIFDISPLEGLTNLTELDLSGNEISDVSPLRGLLNLKILNLSRNYISDFSPIDRLIQNLVKYNNSNQKLLIYRREDVNRDEVVNILDLVLTASYFDTPNLDALAEMNIYPDVDKNGVVDIRDLIIIAAEIGSAAAPTLRKNSLNISNLTTEILTHWIQLAKKLDKHRPQTQKGIFVLEQLLATLILEETIRYETALFANYPNPFNPETWIPYQLEKPTTVTIIIHNVDGSVIRSLELGYLPTGVYRSKSRAAYWDGRNELGETVANGVYFYTLTAKDFTATRKMTIQK